MRAQAHLLAEGVKPESVVVTGNTIVDAMHFIQETEAFKRTPLPVTARHGERLLLVTLHRRESWGPVFEGMCRALRAIVERHSDVRIAFPVHLNPAVRDAVFAILGTTDRCSLLEPLDYLSFLSLVRASWLVLTDSGGVQEEAPTLGVPVFVLRTTTERPEAVEQGVARLVGTDCDAIVAAISELLATPQMHARMARPLNVFGDGRAAERIADCVVGCAA
jgi:UDP-N-acetylglucosamine 2-epimerase (non-hydrolysing)